MEKRFIAIEESIKKLSQTVEAGFAKSNSNFEAVAGEVKSISKKAETISGRLDTLSGIVEPLSDNLKNVSEKVETLSDNLKNVSERVETGFAKVDEQFVIAENNFKHIITYVGNTFDTLEKKIDDLKEEHSKKIDDLKNETILRFGAVDKKFEGIDKRFDRLDERLDTSEKKINLLKVEATRKLDGIEHRLDIASIKFSAIETRFNTVDIKFDSVNRRINKGEEKIDRLDKSLTADKLEDNLTAKKQALGAGIRELLQSLDSELRKII